MRAVFVLHLIAIFPVAWYRQGDGLRKVMYASMRWRLDEWLAAVYVCLNIHRPTMNTLYLPGCVMIPWSNVGIVAVHFFPFRRDR